MPSAGKRKTGEPERLFPSKSRIERAGKQLRDHVMKRTVLDGAALESALEVVTTFREAHGPPMNKVTTDLVQMIEQAGIEAAVSNRHKRVPRIIRKLVRMRGTNLARLEDIGGCRVVVQDLMDLDPVCDLITEAWGQHFRRPVRDYIADPKSTGYRARHFVVVRDERCIEIQVRTDGQQRWADAVEALDARRHDMELKDGEGPPEVLEYFRVAGEFIYLVEAGAHVDDDVKFRLARARRAVVEGGFYEK